MRYVSNSGTFEVDTKPNFQGNLSIAERGQNSTCIEIRSDINSDNYLDENTIPIQIVGNHRYIRETIFDNVEKKNREHVPEEIDDTCVYIVWTPQNFWSLFRYFTTLCMKRSITEKEDVLGDMLNQVKSNVFLFN